jgi:RNA polymerase sigma-70 factor (ECF subfamily)
MDLNSVFSISNANFKDADGMALLFDRAKKGEDAAFGEIYNLFFKKIYRFIFFRVGHKEVAEDLAEEVFLKGFSKISSVNESAALEGWLYQIARNLVIDYYRQKKSTVALEEIENTLEYETNVVDVVNLQEQQKIFLKLLKELGAEQQVVIKLKFFEELENSEIAELMGKNEGAVRVIQHRAIIKLQELIKKSGTDKE